MGHAGTIDAPLAFKMEHTLIFWSFLTLQVFSSWAFERGTPNRPHVLYNGNPAINTVHRLIGPRERQCNDAQPVFQKSSFICHLTPATNTSDSSAGPARLASQAHHQFINHPGLIPPSIHLFMWPAFHTFYHKLLLHNNHNPAVYSDTVEIPQAIKRKSRRSTERSRGAIGWLIFQSHGCTLF